MAEFRTDIDALRAFSVASVVLYHFHVPGFGGGFVGVDVFFVISGYLMTSLLTARPLDGGAVMRFWRARLARIVPAHVVLLVVVAALATVILDPVQQNRLLGELGPAAAFVSNVFYATHFGYFDIESQQRWFLHTWSLATEVQFYFAYPLFLWLASRMRISVTVAIVALLAVSLALVLVTGLVRPAAMFYLLPFRGWEMAAGGLAQRFASIPGRRPVAIVAGLALLGSVTLVAPTWNWPSAPTMIPVFAAALFLAARTDWSASPIYRVLHPIGLWSYSIYLWHWVICLWLHYRFAEWTPALTVLGIALSIAAGALSHRLVEGPARSYFARRSPSVSLAATALAAGALAVVGLVPAERQNLRVLANPEEAALWRSLVTARDDGPPTNRCSGFDRSGNLRTCDFRRDDGPGARALVIGDSHAQMWISRLEHLATAPEGRGIERLTLSAIQGCPILPGVDQPPRRCIAFNDATYAMASSGAWDHVVFVSLWHYFSRPLGICRQDGETCRPGDGRAILSATFEGFAERVRALARAGIAVTIVLPSISSPWDTPSELARRHFLGEDPGPVERLAKIAKTEERAHVVELIAPLAAVPGVRILDPFEAFCDGTTCRTIDETGAPLFRDANHIRASIAARSTIIDPGLGR